MSAVGSILSSDGALSALNSLRNSSNQVSKLQAELASVRKINIPADNPSGYITIQGFKSQLNGINQATSNVNQGVSLVQTAQGAIDQQTSIVQKLNAIAVQAANGTQSPVEAYSLQKVVSQLTSQFTTIANQTQFNNINLLNGSFTGVPFQIGANNGQTFYLSIRNTQANTIGMYASQGTGGNTVYGSAIAQSVLTTVSSSTSSNAGKTPKRTSGTSGHTSHGIGQPCQNGNGNNPCKRNNGNSGLNGNTGRVSTNTSSSTSSGNGAFTAGSFAITGSNGTATVTVKRADESAASIASSINHTTSTTNVAAQATTQALVGTSGSGFNFILGNGVAGSATNTAHIIATNQSGLIRAINNKSSHTGITAKRVNNQIQLAQKQGRNITITHVKNGTLTMNGQSLGSGGAASGTIQGRVQLQSDRPFSLGPNASIIGLSRYATLHKLSNINVSTTSGAQKAINVIKYTLQGLGAAGGKLGAVQQRFQANINNLHTTSQNLSSAKSVVQDAKQLTQQQVLQQAGILALKNSASLQNQYAQILP